MPSLEVVLRSGAFPETYLDAGVLHDALEESAKDLTAQWPVDFKWVDLRVVANATNFQDLISANYEKDLRELADLRLVRGGFLVLGVCGFGGWRWGVVQRVCASTNQSVIRHHTRPQ